MKLIDKHSKMNKKVISFEKLSSFWIGRRIQNKNKYFCSFSK